MSTLKHSVILRPRRLRPKDLNRCVLPLPWPLLRSQLIPAFLRPSTARAVFSSHAGCAQSVSRARKDLIRIRAKAPGVRHLYPTCHSNNPNYLFTSTLLIQPLAPFPHSQ